VQLGTDGMKYPPRRMMRVSQTPAFGRILGHMELTFELPWLPDTFEGLGLDSEQ
jgi:hypothetical protein